MNYISLYTEYFPDPSKGVPLQSGYVYIGEPDTDPEVVANQKSVTLRQVTGVDVVAVLGEIVKPEYPIHAVVSAKQL